MSDSEPGPQPPPAPLEARDPERASVLKMKVRARVGDVRRHLIALRTAMADFGEDFELEAFRSAHASADPQALNRAKAVERGVDQLYNYIADLASCGLELAELRSRGQETNAHRDLQALADNRVLSAELVKRLQRLRELRRLLVHEYATATAEEIHESARIVSDAFPLFYNAYVEWIRRGFTPGQAPSATTTPVRNSR
jgi:uncharacterized protein YutE (UPF0331/DUF86 family)